jgi:hypothetical protein
VSDARRYTATVRWNRRGAVFTDRRYFRAHIWAFDCGADDCFIANSVLTEIIIR